MSRQINLVGNQSQQGQAANVQDEERGRNKKNIQNVHNSLPNLLIKISTSVDINGKPNSKKNKKKNKG